MLLKCSVNCVRFGLFSSFCSLAQSSTSGIWRTAGSKNVTLDASNNSKRLSVGLSDEPPYLNLVEQLRIKKRQLISNLMAAEVVQGSWPENDTQASQ